jgi:hypothetical protein
MITHVEHHMRTFSRHFLTRLILGPFLYVKGASFLTGDTFIRKISIAAFENIPNISIQSFVWRKWRSDRWLGCGGPPQPHSGATVFSFFKPPLGAKISVIPLGKLHTIFGPGCKAVLGLRKLRTHFSYCIILRFFETKFKYIFVRVVIRDNVFVPQILATCV